MIRVGVDVVDIARIEGVMSSNPGWAERVFTSDEISYAQRRPNPGQHLAARFAAKEATFKAIGAGWPALNWQDVEVVSKDGAPFLQIKGAAAKMAGKHRSSISLAHDGGVAVAYVVLEGRARPPVCDFDHV